MTPTRIDDTRVLLRGMELRVRRLSGIGTAADPGPTLAFLHDSLGCVETWRDFPQTLAARAGLDAIVYDRRGYGQSSPMLRTRRTTSYLTDEAVVLSELLDALGIRDVILFGHSDGGSIALIAAAMRQPSVRAIITEGAHVFVEDVTLAGIRDARAELETTDLAARLARYHGDRVPALTSAWIDTWLSPEFRDWNITAMLPNAVCPALIVQGTADEFGTPDQVRAIVDGMGGRARALLLPGVGHTPHREARDAVLEESASFITELVGARGPQPWPSSGVP